ncbi:hypothetical protein [Shewanella surugensis]|uniref:Uncharacterized protein n=1 Tax=Shewanella surugensis TaxID=212020 RepID=A0ABT0LKH6_9GAMM|nr:hypothetical protein [Shewanella surugensis]MCL1127900.1 hypothetical protein [Shewanella surugensis]
MEKPPLKSEANSFYNSLLGSYAPIKKQYLSYRIYSIKSTTQRYIPKGIQVADSSV